MKCLSSVRCCAVLSTAEGVGQGILEAIPGAKITRVGAAHIRQVMVIVSSHLAFTTSPEEEPLPLFTGEWNKVREVRNPHQNHIVAKLGAKL